MINTQFYVIQPSERLLERADGDQTLQYLLSQPFVVANPQRIGTLFVSGKEYDLQVKLFFLIRLLEQYSAVPSVAGLFDGEPLNAELFDRWWELRRTETPAQVPSGEAPIAAKSLRRSAVPPTGSDLIDRWLDHCVAFRDPD